MADLSNRSFIPKQGPVKRKKGAAVRHVYLFTIVSYVMMFATLLSTGAVFLYEEYVKKQEEQKIAELNQAIDGFSEANMDRVLDFDKRLDQVVGRVEKGVSIVSIFKALEEATVQTIQLDSLTLNRQGDEKYSLKAVIGTDSFDSTIFQRDVYKDNDTIATVTFLNVQSAETENEGGAIDGEGPQSEVTFSAELEVEVDDVLFQGDESEFLQPNVIVDPETEAALQVSTEIETVEDDVGQIDDNPDSI